MLSFPIPPGIIEGYKAIDEIAAHREVIASELCTAILETWISHVSEESRHNMKSQLKEFWTRTWIGLAKAPVLRLQAVNSIVP